MHVRAPVGTRIEDTAARFERISRTVREIVPASELASITDNIGLPVSSINTIYNNSGTIGPQDGDIMISLKEGHRPTDEIVATLRRELPRRFPGTTFSFLPADITSQILNFGAPAPIDVQISGQGSGRQPRLCREAAGENGGDPRPRRCAHPAARPLAAARCGRQPLARQPIWPQRARCDQQPVALACRHRADRRRCSSSNPVNGVSYPVIAQTPEYRSAR
ncbi:MAG: hypothetical protein P0Y64_08545 [Candidatus Sphingomonas colombiensis]|nr:hypothetical protein [Sphingomonas sp.]WEK44804.1 MAG: hypothetical protein P0Y64_08545 [Sphingomonas sp.]